MTWKRAHGNPNTKWLDIIKEVQQPRDQYVEQRRLGPRQQLLVKSGKAEKGATKSDDVVDTGSLQCKRFKLQKTYLNNIHSRASRSKLCMSGVFNDTYKLLKQEP